MIKNIISDPCQAFTGAFLFCENQITTGDGTGERTEIMADIRLFKRDMG